MHHPAGELQILSRAQRQQVADQPRMAGAGMGTGGQHLTGVQKQHGRILRGDDVDHERLPRNAGIRLGEGSAGGNAAQHAVVAPDVAHFDDDPARENHAKLLRGRALHQDDLALFAGSRFRVQAAQQRVDLLRGHAAKKRGVRQMKTHIFLLHVGMPTDFHD